MRIIVMLRPTNRRGTKTAYTNYRKMLVAEGFTLLQPEVFMRVSPTRRTAEALLAHLREDVPQTGAICALTLTERQYASMTWLTGSPDRQEQLIGSRRQVEL